MAAVLFRRGSDSGHLSSRAGSSSVPEREVEGSARCVAGYEDGLHVLPED